MRGGDSGNPLCNRIKVARARHDLTQEQLADLVGVTRKTINTVETGKFVPSTVLALKLARVLHTTVEELFQLADTQEPLSFPPQHGQLDVPPVDGHRG